MSLAENYNSTKYQNSWKRRMFLSLINMRVVLDRQGPLSMSFHTHKAYQDKVDHCCVPQDVRTRTRFGGFQLR